ncbi:MAG: hypothetical protein QXU45_07960 [Candidatus Bathyarchaeia archaeon]
MQKSWTSQNISIQTLTEEITKFLEREDFDLTVYQEEEGYLIIATNSPKYGIEGDIAIQIHGNPNNFSIRIENKKERSEYKIPPLLATMFGGGYFLLKRLKTEEKYIEFTREFWRNVNKILNEIKI